MTKYFIPPNLFNDKGVYNLFCTKEFSTIRTPKMTKHLDTPFDPKAIIEAGNSLEKMITPYQQRMKENLSANIENTYPFIDRKTSKWASRMVIVWGSVILSLVIALAYFLETLK